MRPTQLDEGELVGKDESMISTFQDNFSAMIARHIIPERNPSNSEEDVRASKIDLGLCCLLGFLID